MRKWMLAAVIGPALAMGAFAAQAQGAWGNYVVKELGIAFSAPGKVETSVGTFRGEIAGPRQTMIFKSSANNIEYRVTVMSFKQAQGESATILGERTYMFQDKKNVLVDTWARVEPGKDAVYGRKMVVDQAEGKGRTTGAFYFTKGRLIALEATVAANGDKESPDPARFIESIAFNVNRAGPNAAQLAAPKID